MARIYISCSDLDASALVRMKDWLKSEGYEHIAIDELAHSESEGWGGWQKELAQTLEQCDATILILTPNWLNSKWCFAEFTKAFSMGKAILAVIETPLSESFSESGIQIFDLTENRENGLANFSAALRDVTPYVRDVFEWDPERRPYPGLCAFEEKDAAVFFGRDDDIRRVTDRLNALRRQGGSRLIALLGATGTGISSLLSAGVLPRLKRDANNWIALPSLRPRLQPVDELARSISTAFGQPERWPDWSILLKGQDFKQVVTRLSEQLRDRFNQKGAQILVSIDQAEDLFTISDPQETGRFLDILGVMFDDDMPFFGVAALRPDFLTAFQTAEQLSHLVEEMSPRLMPLSRIREVITGPSEKTDVSIDESVIQAIISDAAKEGALPLVGHTLRVLYDQAGDNRRLTLGGYTFLTDPASSVSPLGYSVTKVAEDAFVTHDFSDDELSRLHELFVIDMLWKGGESQYVARPLRWEDIPPNFHPFIHQLVDVGVLATYGLYEDETVEFAHLSVLQHWPRLVDWLEAPPEGADEQQETESFKDNVDDFYSSDEPLLPPDGLEDSPLHVTVEPMIESHHDLHVGTFTSLDTPLEIEARPVSRLLTDDDFTARPQSKYSRDAEDLVPEAEVTWHEVETQDIQPTQKQDTRPSPKRRRKRKLKRRSGDNKTLDDALTQMSGAHASAKSAEPRDKKKKERLSKEKPSKVRLVASGALVAVLAASAILIWPKFQDGFSSLKGENEVVQKDVSVETQQATRLQPAHIPVPDKDQASGTKVQAARAAPLDNVQDKSPPRRATSVTSLLNAAESEIKSGEPVTAMLLALEALQSQAEGGVQQEKDLQDLSERSLYRSLTSLQSSVALKGHDGAVESIAFSPDALYIATASSDRTIRVWDMTNGQTILELRGHSGRVNSVAYSPDGRLLVTASSDKTSRIWDVQTGKMLKVLQGHTGDVKAAVFNPRGNRIATASADGSARLWNPVTGEMILLMRGHQNAVNNIVFSPDGARLATASQDRTARLWDMSSGAQIAALEGHKKPLNSIGFSRDARFIVTASNDHTARIWDANSFKQIRILRGHTNPVLSASFGPEAKRIITTHKDGTALIWSAHEGKIVAVFQGHKQPLNKAIFSSDGAWIATASKDKIGRVVPTKLLLMQRALEGHTDSVYSASFSGDGSLVVTASRDNTARVWNAPSGIQKSILMGHTDRVHHAVFSPDRKLIATASNDKTVRLWDARSGVEQNVLEGHVGEVYRVAFSPDNRILASAARDKTVRLWNVATGELVAVLEGHGGPVWNVIFSSDGTKIFTASQDSTVGIWDADTRKQTVVLRGHKAAVFGLSVNANGTRLATTSADKTARLWDLVNGQVLPQILKHNDIVMSANFSRDGERLITGSLAKNARIWDADTGREITKLTGHRDRVLSGEFSPDNKWALTGSSDGTARLWRVFSGVKEMVEYAKSIAPRCLNADERSKLGLNPAEPQWCVEFGNKQFVEDKRPRPAN